MSARIVFVRIMSVLVTLSFSVAVCAQNIESVDSRVESSQEKFSGANILAVGANCQLLDDSVDRFVVPSDLSAWAGPTTRADDFIPSGTTINTVSVWGTYLDGSDPDGDGIFYCVDAATDQFTVSVYADLDGRPGALVGRSSVDPSNLVRGVRPNSGYEQWYGALGGGVLHSYQLTLDFPITKITPGERHWLEVVNDTGADGFFNNDCVWFWARVETGGVNQYSYAGTRDDVGNPLYAAGGMRSDDLAFCLDMGIFAPADVGRACCQCSDAGGTCVVSSFNDCVLSSGSWDPNAASCPALGCPCDVPGDSCSSGGECITFLTDENPSTTRVSVSFDNTCAVTDGSPVVNSLSGQFELGQDLWYRYTADCTGLMTVSMCGTGSQFDSAIALYHNFQLPNDCFCPFNLPIESFPARDENCTGIVDAGAGWVRRVVFPEECWLIRVGGFTAQRGVGSFDISCEGHRCVPLPAPMPDLLANEAGTLVPNAKNRSLSFVASNDSIPSAYRVTFVDLPPPHDVWNGRRMWVTAPRQVTELSGATGQESPTVTIAGLGCDPMYMDWSGEGTVHVVHEGIVPGGRYEVQRSEQQPHFSPDSCISDPLEIINSQWGDTVGRYSNAPQFWFAADGSVDVTFDVVAAIQKFANLPGAPSKVRVDLVPANLDLVIDITDIVAVINAFGGKAYSFEQFGSVPCQ